MKNLFIAFLLGCSFLMLESCAKESNPILDDSENTILNSLNDQENLDLRATSSYTKCRYKVTSSSATKGFTLGGDYSNGSYVCTNCPGSCAKTITNVKIFNAGGDHIGWVSGERGGSSKRCHACEGTDI